MLNCQGRINSFIRGATLHSRECARALIGIPTYPRQLTYAPTLQNILRKPHLTAPSAVHLTTCFLPDSQHHRLSVRASLPLSPPHRFSVLNGLWYSTTTSVCQEPYPNFSDLSCRKPIFHCSFSDRYLSPLSLPSVSKKGMIGTNENRQGRQNGQKRYSQAVFRS